MPYQFVAKDLAQAGSLVFWFTQLRIVAPNLYT